MYEEFTTHADTMCGNSEAGDDSTYYACLNAYFHTLRAVERYCVIVTTDAVFLFATAVVLAIIGLLTYKSIGKVRREEVVVR